VRSLESDIMLKKIKQLQSTSVVSWQPELSKFSMEKLEITRDFLAAKKAAGVDFKMVFFWDNISVYTNDTSIMEIKDLLPELWIRMTRAQVTRPKDTVALSNSAHQYRTYLKSKIFTHDERENLKSWVQSQGQDIRPCKAFEQWLENDHKYTMSGRLIRLYTATHYFIDHNSSTYETMLSLIKPGIIRKTMPIIKKQ